MLATDPKEQARDPTAKCSGAISKPIPSRPTFATNHAIESPREAARIYSPATSAQPIDDRPEHARTEFLYPTGCLAGRDELVRPGLELEGLRKGGG